MFEQLDLFAVSEEVDELENTKLSDRQKRTFNLIKNNSFLRRTTSQKELVDNYSAMIHEDGYVWNNNPKVHDHCSTIWQDINKINLDRNIHEVVIWDDNYNYKLADNAEEVEAFCQKLYWEKAMAKLARQGNLMRKVKRDGQANLFKEENMREYWQTFLQSHIDDLVILSMQENKENESDSK